VEKKIHEIEASQRRMRRQLAASIMLLVAALVSGCTCLECEIETLQDEFGTLTLEMSTHTHGSCCGIMRQFLKVAASGSQPWIF
jgi:hypothetical protein